MTEGPPYRDAGRSTAERVTDLVGRMTLAEKVAQLGAVWLSSITTDDEFDPDKAGECFRNGIGQVTRVGGSTCLGPHESAEMVDAIQRFVVERTRLGVPIVIHEEAVGGFLHRDATVFPQALALAATWDPDLVEEAAGVIRVQMLAVGARHALAPVLDVARDPRWGRVEETYGESPELCARMGVAFVKGLQGDDLADGVMCTGKHFLGYGAPIGGRNQAPVHLGPRELREVYAEPFAAAIREAGLATVMNSYSSVDGIPCAGSREILTELLRDELGFDGTVVADYFAVRQLETHHRTAGDRAEAASQALSAGLDVELPSLDYYRSLPEAVAAGRIDEALIDTALGRVLRQKFDLGLFENPYVDPSRAGEVFDTPAQRSLARRAATGAMCLLSNDGTLPVDPAVLTRVAVIGPHADDPRLLQGDYHHPTHLEVMTPIVDGQPVDMPTVLHVTPLAGLRAALGDAVEVVHAKGCADAGTDTTGISAAVAVAAVSDVAIVCVGTRSGLTPDATVGEARDSVSLDLPGEQIRLVREVAATGTPTVVVVISGRVHALTDVVDAAAAVIWTAPPGEEGGSALADVLVGAADPSGRLPVSFPRHVGQIPVHHDMRARGDRSEFWLEYVDSPVTPLFPFGHGLSYTTFGYSEPDVATGSTTRPTLVSVEVTNTGDRDGTEVVQLYVRDDVASTARPIKELIGFGRVDLRVGVTRTVMFTVDPSRLAFHRPDMKLVTEPGTFTFWVGGSSADTRSAARVDLPGEVAEFDRRGLVPTRVSVSSR